MGMIEGSQIRAARALLGWTTAELASRSGLTYTTVLRAERADGVPSMRTDNLQRLERTFAEAGIRFTDNGGQAVGVKLYRGEARPPAA